MCLFLNSIKRIIRYFIKKIYIFHVLKDIWQFFQTKSEGTFLNSILRKILSLHFTNCSFLYVFYVFYCFLYGPSCSSVLVFIIFYLVHMTNQLSLNLRSMFLWQVSQIQARGLIYMLTYVSYILAGPVSILFKAQSAP